MALGARSATVRFFPAAVTVARRLGRVLVSFNLNRLVGRDRNLPADAAEAAVFQAGTALPEPKVYVTSGSHLGWSRGVSNVRFCDLLEKVRANWDLSCVWKMRRNLKE